MTRMRILIVDDEVGAARLLKANLELTNVYEVRVESSPENAVAVAREFEPHLVLLDLVMPKMSGGEVVRALRSEPGLECVPIALLTAADSSMLSVPNEPALDHLARLTKPVCMEDILQFLEEHLLRLPALGSTVRGPAGAATERIE